MDELMRSVVVFVIKKVLNEVWNAFKKWRTEKKVVKLLAEKKEPSADAEKEK